VKPTPVRVFAAFGLMIVKLRLVLPFRAIVAAPKALLMVGGAGDTLRLAEAVDPAPDSVEVILPVVLFLAPGVVPLTFAEKVQEAELASIAPDKLMLPEPAATVKVPPPHEPVNPFGDATTSPEGSESMKLMPVRMIAEFGLVIVNVRLVVPFSPIVAPPKALLIVGGGVPVHIPVGPLAVLVATLLFGAEHESWVVTTASQMALFLVIMPIAEVILRLAIRLLT
jgi:hypothetical protein